MTNSISPAKKYVFYTKKKIDLQHSHYVTFGEKGRGAKVLQTYRHTGIQTDIQTDPLMLLKIFMS